MDLKEIGIDSQVQKFVPNPELGEGHPFYSLPLEGEIDKNRKFPTLLMEKEAKWMDLLSFIPGSGRFLLISSRFHVLLNRFKLADYQIFPVLVQQGSVVRDYFLLYFTKNRAAEFVDWGHTEVMHTTDFAAQVIKMGLKFSSYEEFLARKMELLHIKENLYVRALKLSKAAEGTDMFRFIFVPSGFYVSERLKDAIEKEGLVGIRFIPTEELGELTPEEKKIKMQMAAAAYNN
ncbi:MAG TPA: hypothetical protein DCF44_01715 [Chitinophagaceae bacterium]|nr:hypothetical protein [Chitinophagaceae bacterium]